MTAPHGPVLHLTPVGDAGGALTVVGALATGLHAAGVPVHVVGLVGNRPSQPWLEGLAATGIRTHAVALRSRGYSAETAEVRAIAREVGASIIHSHVYQANFVGWRATGHGIAHVATAHGFTGGSWKNRAYEALSRWIMARTDATIAVSAPLAASLARAGVSADRLHTVANVLQPAAPLSREAARQRLGLPHEGRIVGFIGRLSHEKGADLLVRAAPLLPEGVTVALIGDGPERQDLEALAASLGPALGASRQVRFLGLQQDAGQLLTAFDVVCLPSRTEGTPMVLLEALAAQVPAVAFAVGGIPDVLRTAPSLLAPPGDIAALAAAITTQLDHPSDAVALVRAIAASRATTHSPDAWITAHRQIYAEARLRVTRRR